MERNTQPVPANPRFPLFENLTQAEIVEILEICEKRSFPRGTYIFRQGDPGTSLFLLESGALNVLLENDGRKESIAHLGPGDVLGELALIDRADRSATALVTEPVEAFELSALRFDALRDNLRPAAHKLLRALSSVICRRIRAVNARIEQALESTNSSSFPAADLANPARATGDVPVVVAQDLASRLDIEPAPGGSVGRIVSRIWGPVE